MLDLDNISQNCCPWPKVVPWPWTKVTSPRSRSQCAHTGSSYPGHNSCQVRSHSIVVNDPKTWHYLDPRSYLQGQGHSTHKTNIFVRPINPKRHVGSGCYFTMALTQGHLSLGSMLEFRHCKNLFPGINFHRFHNFDGDVTCTSLNCLPQNELLLQGVL